MSYKCEHFKIHELVPPQVFKDRGEKAWELMDDRLCEGVDALREHFGPATINNYNWGGDRTESGLRIPSSKWYSPYSQHTFGRAADLLFKEATADEVREYIREVWKNYTQSSISPPEYPIVEIHGLEEGISWVHIDVRNYDGLKVFTP